MRIGPKGGSCGTAVYRREPVFVTDILATRSGMTIVICLCRTGYVPCGRGPCSRKKGKCLGHSPSFIAKCVARLPAIFS